MMGVNTRNMKSCLQKCNKLNKSHLVGKLLSLIHDARSHVYKKFTMILHVFDVVVLCVCVCVLHMVKDIMTYQNTVELGNGPL